MECVQARSSRAWVGPLALALVAIGCLRSQPAAKERCTGDADCGNGPACLNGECVDRTCSRDAECPEGLVCTGGICGPNRRNCVTNGDCAAPMVCANLLCVELAPIDCELAPTTVDFGTVSAGSQPPATLEVLNHTDAPFFVSIGDIGFGNESAFAFGSDFASGDHVVPASAPDTTPGRLLVPLVFKPGALGEYSDTLPILRPCTGEVTLHAIVVEHTLECSFGCPSGEPTKATCRAEFTYVNPGAKLVQKVIFTNLGSRAIRLALGAITQPPNVTGEPYAIEESNLIFSIPPGQGSVSIALSFAPTQLGLQMATLAYSSDDSSRPSGTIELYGVGGGPVIDVQPASLDFDRVAVGTNQVRRVTVANHGQDVGGTTDDNLLFAALDRCSWVQKRAEIAGPNASDFGVDWPPQGYDADGLAEAQNADLRVKFAPLTAGRKRAVLRIFSSDRATPTLEVPLSGIGVDLPPCDYDVIPAALDFGSVESNRYLTLTVSIINRATSPGDACLLSLLDLDRSTRERGGFTLVNGPQGSDSAVVIPGGGKLDVPVRFAPVWDGQYSGELDFLLSSPTRPEVKVSLSGVAAPSCLMISPREFDFGTIGVNCSSRQRLFTMSNTCSSNVIVTAIAMPPGPSAEFSITRRPVLPITIPGGASADLGVTYHPVDLGDDSAAVSVTLQGNSNPLIISLMGRGATDPIQTDVFGATDNKVDVLLIIDDSSSMSAKQASLASNFNNFIRAANQNLVDYHIAATTVSLDAPSDECGRFVPLTGSSPRVITPSTPSKEQVFSQNVQLGTAGTTTESLIRPAYLALTNPLINGHNAGFYRDEAQLAIVVLSDAADQDPLTTPVSFYENFFIGLKGVARRDDFSFSGFIPLMTTDPDPSSSCDYDAPGAGLDTRVKQLIQDTGGIAEEICSSDWPAAVGRMGDSLFSRRRTIHHLSSAPDMTVAPDPIVVTVDGAPYPQVSASGQQQWTYDSAANAIQFDPQATPGLMSTITVSYHVACL